MSVIKLHLEYAEYSALARYAEALGIDPEEIVYAALNRLMLAGGSPETNREIIETREWRRDNLPLWSDSACASHAYEGKASPDSQPAHYSYHRPR